MSRRRRIESEAVAELRSFLRRRAAVFFTFVFPVLFVLIFGVLVGARAGGLFGRPPRYYVPGYLAFVVLFTPMSRLGSSVARHRDGNRFQKLATTPLTRLDWLIAHVLVNGIVVAGAAALIFGLTVAGTGAAVVITLPSLLVVGAAVALAVPVFGGIGAILGRVTDSHDGVIAAANGVSAPLVFLSETFVPPALLPAWFRPAVALSPLTYFARAVRAATTGGDPLPALGILADLAVAAVLAGAAALPWTE